jgi:hypothetical protein
VHTAVTQLYTDEGFVNQTPSGGGVGGGIVDTVVAPISAAGGIIGNTAPHIHLWGLVLFLIALWALVRVAGFRFVITTGVG